MPDIKLGSNETMIGCLKVKGCLWSTPCMCYNCEHLSSKKLRKWIKILNKKKPLTNNIKKND